MDLDYADQTIAARPSRFSLPVAYFTGMWLTVVVLPPVLYMPIIWNVYRNAKVELPELTRSLSAFVDWNMQYGWIWLVAPIVAGLLAARFAPEPTDTLSAFRQRQEWLYAALILTLVALLAAILQMVVLWFPWVTIMMSVSNPKK